MKKLIIFMLLFTGIVNAQIVNIPDANFKAKLIAADVNNYIAKDANGFVKIDTNNDGQIQDSEAVLIISLDVELSSISDLTGISSFINLVNLKCGGNSLSTFDITNLLSLRSLNCQGNQLLTTLNISMLVNLQELEFSNCNVNVFDLSALINLKKLRCLNNGISNLNISMLTNLEDLDFFSNLVATYDFTGLNNLKKLNCGANLFTNLNVNFLTGLEELTYGNGNLAPVDITNLINLRHFAFYSGNQLPAGLENFPNLQSLSVNGTTISYLDVSYLPHINDFWCSNNVFLNYVNIKNGGQLSQFVNFNNNSNLRFICVNDIDLQSVTNNVFDNNTELQISSYCNFTPGGVYNTITGTTSFDTNNNGCDNNDLILQNQKININDGTNNGATFTNIDGNYNFYVQQPNLELSPYFENPSYFNVNPVIATINFPNNSNNLQYQNFCIAPNGIHNDLEIVLMPTNSARPGFNAKYKIIYKNKGNQTLSGNVNLTYDDAVLDFFTSSLNPNILTSGNLTWNYTNLTPFESRSIVLEFTANAPTATPPLNDGDILNFAATINPNVNDDLPTDNSFSYNQTVINSYDPNDITCLEGDSLSPTEIGKYLHYVVQFENIGTAEAINVVVKNVIDANKYDINSLQIMNASANVRTVITNNTVEFIFQNINLAARSGNPPVGGHGDVLFKIKTNQTLTDGASVLNKANIYFDYNFPIITNDAITTFASLSSKVFKIDESVSVSPNPASSKVNFICNSNIKSIELYDVQGRILETILNANTLDISGKTNGIYFLKITTENGSRVEKIVKE